MYPYVRQTVLQRKLGRFPSSHTLATICHCKTKNVIEFLSRKLPVSHYTAFVQQISIEASRRIEILIISTTHHKQLSRQLTKSIMYEFPIVSKRQFHLRLLTHVKVSVRCLFKRWPIQSFGVVITFSIVRCFHIQRQLIFTCLQLTYNC